MEHPDLPALDEALDKSKLWMEAVQVATDGVQFDTTPRRRLAVTLHHLALEHHQAIHTLVDLHVWGSAFALMRPQLEAYVRGLWYDACATDEQVKAFYNDEEPPPFRELVEQLEAAGAVDETLFRIHQTSWRQLCGFTHGGLVQVSNRTTRDDIISRYELTDLSKLIGASAVLSLSAAVGIARAIESKDLAVKSAKAYDAIYGTVIGVKLPT